MTTELEQAAIPRTHTLSPFQLEFLLHCYYSETQWSRLHYLGGKDAAVYLQEKEIVYAIPDRAGVYKLTRKGEIFLDAILNTPFPVLQYVMPAWHGETKC